MVYASISNYLLPYDGWFPNLKPLNFIIAISFRSLEGMVNKIESAIKQNIIVGLGVSLLHIMIVVFTPTNYGLWVAAQQIITDKTYHSNPTGATITFHDHSITSKTSNITRTNTSGITGFGPQNSMRNMTNPMFLMKKNLLSNLSNPLANMKNHFAK